jgi:cytochrome c oxidase subunit 3
VTQHHSALAHHFDTLEQQKEASTLGMWAFLATEVMLFGGVFMAYIAYRWAYPEVFIEGAYHLNTWLGIINTVVLLVSSLTVALAVHAAEQGNNRRTINFLLITLVLGFTFLGIKGFEYYEKFEKCWEVPVKECMIPGRAFKWEPAEPQVTTLFSFTGETHGSGEGHGGGTAHGGEGEEHGGLRGTADERTGPSIGFEGLRAGESEAPYDVHQIFFLVYFTATGLHAFHMIIGSAVLITLAWMASKGRFSTEYYTPVELGGLYWHLIDIVWVFLFPLLYLIH